MNKVKGEDNAVNILSPYTHYSMQCHYYTINANPCTRVYSANLKETLFQVSWRSTYIQWFLFNSSVY